MTMVDAKLTWGDVVDRISILDIKKANGLDVDLTPYMPAFEYDPFIRSTETYHQLFHVNSILWYLEGEIRNAHACGDTSRIQDLSWDIIQYNQRRSEIKSQIDGELAEQKDYS